MMRVVSLLLLLLAAPIEQARTGAEHQARLEEWVDPLAEKLLAALPEPGDGLAEFAPWDYEFREPTNWGCPLGCTQLTQIEVQRPYVVVEPALATRVEAAAARALANATKIVSNPGDTTKAMAAQNALEDEEERLRKSVRRLSAEIRINGEAPAPRGVEKAPTRAGVVSGYPVYRFGFNDSSYEPTPAGVRLAIMIGPDGFKNPRVKDNSVMLTEARTAVISVSVQSRSETVAADEAIARALLARVDVAAIAALLKP
jgi:hypothetical protein